MCAGVFADSVLVKKLQLLTEQLQFFSFVFCGEQLQLFYALRKKTAVAHLLFFGRVKTAFCVILS